MGKKINISIVGTGLMGLQHIKAIQKSKKANLHSIVDISNNAKNLSKKYKIPLYSNVSELLNSKKLDAVIVATPNQLHEKHTVSFLKNKIPVLLEKPISDNIQSAKKIINSANKNKTPLLIGYHRRHNSIVSKLKTLLTKVDWVILFLQTSYAGYINIKLITKKNGGLVKVVGL